MENSIKFENQKNLFNQHFDNAELLKNSGDYYSAILQYTTALQSNQNDFQSLHNMGFCFFRIGDYDSTIKWMAMANKIDPNKFGTYYHMGLSFLNLKNMKQAIKSLRKALGLKPEHFRARYLLGKTLYQTRRYKQAIIELTAAKDLNKDDFDTHFCLGRSQLQIQNYTEAISQFQEGLRINSSHLDNYYYLGKTLSLAGLPSHAIKILKTVSQVYPNNFIYHCTLGKAYFQNGDKEYAINSLLMAQQKVPNDSKSHYRLAKFFSSIKEQHKAIQQYTKAKTINSEHFQTHLNLGLSFLQTGDKKSAVESFNYAKKLNSKNYLPYFYLGRFYYFAKDIQSAMRQLNQAKRLNQNHFDTHFYLGLTMRKLVDIKFAIKTLGKSIKNTNFMNLAIQEFTKAKQINPNDVNNLYHLGTCLLQMGNESAIQWLQKANKLKSNDNDIKFSLARVYSRTDRYGTADKIYEECLKDDPKNANAMFNLGSILVKSGKTQQALSHYKKYLKIIPDRIQPYAGLGLLAKKFPEFKQKCDNILVEYKLNLSDNLAIIAGLVVYYDITGNYENTEKYFLKVIKIYQKKDQQANPVIKQFLKEGQFQYFGMISLFPEFVDKFFLLKGLFSKFMGESEDVTQQFKVIYQKSMENGINESSFLLSIFQNQIKDFSAQAQSIMANFILCQMTKVDPFKSIENYIQLNNVYPKAGEQNLFLISIDHYISKKLNSIQEMVIIVQLFIKDKKINVPKIKDNWSNITDSFEQISGILTQIQKIQKLCKKSSLEEQTLAQILQKIIQSQQAVTSKKTKWKNIPHRLSCFYKIYQAITNQEYQLKSKIKLLKIIVKQKNYSKLFDIVTNIKFYLQVKFPVNELVKQIYNCFASNLFKDEEQPRNLSDILNQILKLLKNYDFSMLKKKLSQIIFCSICDKSQTLTEKGRQMTNLLEKQRIYFIQSFKNWQKQRKCQSQLAKRQIKDRQKDFEQSNQSFSILDKQQQQLKQSNYFSYNSVETLSIADKQQDQNKQKSVSMVDNSNISNNNQESSKQYNQKSSNQQLETPIINLVQFGINKFQFGNERKCYQELKYYLFLHVFLIRVYIGTLNLKHIISYPIVSVQTDEKQNILSFQYKQLKWDKMLTQDYSIYGEQRKIRILWGLTRKHIFSFIRCVADSIEELNNKGIYHRNINLKNFKKFGNNFQLVGLEETFFVPQKLKQVKIISNNYQNINQLNSQEKIQQKLTDIIVDVWNFYLRFNFDTGSGGTEWLDNKSRYSKTMKSTSFSERPEIDDIPKYIFGQVNYFFVRDFIKIKTENKFKSTSDKIKQCIQYLQNNYKEMHMRQFKKILEKLLKNKVRVENGNAQKITQDQISLIFRIFKHREKNGQYKQFIINLNRIENKQQIHLSQVQQEQDSFSQNSEEEETNRSVCMIQLENNQIKEILFQFENSQVCAKESLFLPKLQQLNRKNFKLLTISSIVRLEHFCRCIFDEISNSKVGLFPADFLRITDIGDLLSAKSKYIIYQFIISLASLIEELEAHGFYCSLLEYDSVWIKQEQLFKFTNIRNIYKMKQITQLAQKQQSLQSELINSTENIIGYLLDTANPHLEENKKNKKSIQVARNKLKQIIGHKNDVTITKMIQKWHEDIDMKSIRIYMRKFMRNSHLLQFQKIVTDILSLEETKIKADRCNQVLSHRDINEIRIYLEQILKEHYKFKNKRIDYQTFKNHLNKRQIKIAETIPIENDQE